MLLGKRRFEYAQLAFPTIPLRSVGSDGQSVRCREELFHCTRY